MVSCTAATEGGRLLLHRKHHHSWANHRGSGSTEPVLL